MKRFIILFICIACLIITTSAIAATITLNLDSVPTDLDCDTNCLCNTTWEVSDIVLKVTNTISTDGCGSNTCDWEHGDSYFPTIIDKGILLATKDIDPTDAKALEKAYKDYFTRVKRTAEKNRDYVTESIARVKERQDILSTKNFNACLFLGIFPNCGNGGAPSALLGWHESSFVDRKGS